MRQPPEPVLTDAQVRTMDPARRFAQALAMAGGAERRGGNGGRCGRAGRTGHLHGAAAWQGADARG